MKILISKRNPLIRITAPEIVLSANKEQYWIAGIPQTARTYLAKEWTLIEEESKHTEVWLEGRTIFEQDAKKPEVDLEKAVEEYIEKRASLAPNESWDIEDMRAAVRFGAEWQIDIVKKDINGILTDCTTKSGCRTPDYYEGATDACKYLLNKYKEQKNI